MRPSRLISTSPLLIATDPISRLKSQLHEYPNIPVRIVEETLDALTATLALTATTAPAIADFSATDFSAQARHNGT